MQQQTYIRSSEPQSVGEIEARLERDRTALSTSLDALRERLTVDALWQDGVALVSKNAGSYTQTLDAAVRANPLALAVTAVGLAWLILGRRGSSSTETPVLAGTQFEAVTRWEDEGGPVSDPPATDDDWMEEADRLRDRATRMFSDLNSAARRRLVPAADLARSRADIAAALAADVRRAMGRGLESVSSSAREGALAARERAYELRLRAGRAGAEVMRDRPIAAGAAFAVAGAALGMLLPRSTLEDRLLGAPRDQIVDEARRVLQAERQRMSASVRDAAQSLLSELSRPLAKTADRHPTDVR